MMCVGLGLLCVLLCTETSRGFLLCGMGCFAQVPCVSWYRRGICALCSPLAVNAMAASSLHAFSGCLWRPWTVLRPTGTAEIRSVSQPYCCLSASLYGCVGPLIRGSLHHQGNHLAQSAGLCDCREAVTPWVAGAAGVPSCLSCISLLFDGTLAGACAPQRGLQGHLVVDLLAGSHWPCVVGCVRACVFVPAGCESSQWCLCAVG